MLYYVAHKYGNSQKNFARAKAITHKLQTEDKENTYICPLLAFNHLTYGELGFEEKMELCKDLLTVCDALLIASEISPSVQCELDFAELVGMEVRFVENLL
jgi:hypothetical protein